MFSSGCVSSVCLVVGVSVADGVSTSSTCVPDILACASCLYSCVTVCPLAVSPSMDSMPLPGTTVVMLVCGTLIRECSFVR